MQYAIARAIPAETEERGGGVAEEGSQPFNAVDGMMSLAASTVICFAAHHLCAVASLKGALIPVATGG